MAGAPARLELHVREEHLIADRSGLAILEVNAVDEKGDPVPYIHPEIDWQVSGEGHLVGPSTYTSDTDKNGATTGTMYVDLPTANIVRTTAVPGPIQVMVSSPGLAPATIKLHSEASEIPADGIVEPRLSDAGRSEVVRDSAFTGTVNIVPPRVFEHIGQDYKLSAETLVTSRASIERFLHERNPNLNKEDRAYQDSIIKLSRLLYANHGNLIADWYNFTADQYEDVELLAATIERSDIPSVFKTVLENDYADRILSLGEPVDVQRESKELEKALTDAQVVSTAADSQSGVKHTSVETLGELAASSYPSWSHFSAEQQTHALRVLYRFNPSLRTGQTNFSKDQPLPSSPVLLVAESALLQ